MTTRRLITALLAALAISTVCTLLLGHVILHRSSAKTVWVQYVAASRELQPGTVLKPADVSYIRWAGDRALAGAYSKANEVVGRAVLYPVQAGQPIVDKELAAAGSGVGLTTRIPEGMRAVALKSDDVVGVGGFVYPGSHVDVLVTFRTDRSPEPLTATVLEDAEVLATDHQTQPTNDGKPETVNVVTLLLNPEQAEQVVLAATQGTIHFVLRNGADRQHTPSAPALFSQFSQQLPQPSTTAVPRTRQVAAAGRRPYVVETVLGDKTTKAEF